MLAMRRTPVNVVALIFFLCGGAEAQEVPWPFDPGDIVYPIGNNYGEFQSYENQYPERYLHDGLDILSGGKRAVYAVADGTVTHTTKGPQCGFNCGLAIGEPVSEGTGVVYWHLEGDSIRFAVGDVVREDEYLGDVYIPWPVPDFDHIHFSFSQGTRGYPWEWFYGVENPLNRLNPSTDTTPPWFEEIASFGTAPFLFYANDSKSYLDPQHLSGTVDIIANIKDRFNESEWVVAPYRVNLKIEDIDTGHVELVRLFVSFGGAIGTDDDMYVDILYKCDNVARSEGNYDRREFFFIVTNSDGDLLIEGSDHSGAWDTAASPNGRYRIIVEASDCSGNSASEEMVVEVEN